MNRQADLIRFYEILRVLERTVGGKYLLAHCDGRTPWPKRGLYFFFERGELRSQIGQGLRVVRVGTHALKTASATSFWQRLAQHRGTEGSGGGNHRGSIFRLLVGAALKNRDQRLAPMSWGVGGDPGKAARRLALPRKDILEQEHGLEVAVSQYIRSMPFLWVVVNDVSGPRSHRGLIERNSIGLLSNYRRTPLDPPSKEWLGSYCDRERVRGSGLWNNNHVDEEYDPAFLAILEHYAT